MVRDDEIDDALSERLPEPFAVFAFTNRWSTLETRIAVRDVFRSEEEIVRAGLDRHRQPILTRGPQN